MTTVLMILIDLAAIAVLVFGLYLPRHHRADLTAAFLGVNVGVLAVSSVLTVSTVGVGLGLGLFGVLSIIRLRSSEISQREVAYYFASLTIGLLAGMTSTPSWRETGLMVLIIAALAVGDSPRLFGSLDAQQVQLDRAIADPEELREALEALLGVPILGVSVVRLDLVNDLTLVEVRFRRAGRARTRPRSEGRGREGISAIAEDDAPARSHGEARPRAEVA